MVPGRIPLVGGLDPRAAAGTRTQDLVLTKDALYQLSHGSGFGEPSEAKLWGGSSGGDVNRAGGPRSG